ncbi:MAG: copper resistance protein CopC [Caulobacteraceae bacterium]
MLRGSTILALAATSALALAPACAQAADPHAGPTMGGMTMAGMTPPPPTSPPAGSVVALNAGSQNPPSAVRGSPGQIRVDFVQPVTIISLMLTNAVGQQIPTRMTLPVDPVRSVRIPVVIPLRPGAYKVAWRVAAPSGAMNGSSSFKVNLADGGDPAPPAMHHHH